ncbi:MAG: hypothetical protein M3O70_16440 [Actinomycetota bacterium]|nr:hypothetical protein [Actinomycetota bacterium]
MASEREVGQQTHRPTPRRNAWPSTPTTTREQEGAERWQDLYEAARQVVNVWMDREVDEPLTDPLDLALDKRSEALWDVEMFGLHLGWRRNVAKDLDEGAD